MAKPFTSRLKVVSITAGAVAAAPGAAPSGSVTIATVVVDQNGDTQNAGAAPITQSFTSADPAAAKFFTVGTVYDLTFTEADLAAN